MKSKVPYKNIDTEYADKYRYDIDTDIDADMEVEHMETLTVIGGGPGAEAYMLPAACMAMAQADIVIADARYVKIIKHPNVCQMGKLMETIEQIQTYLLTQKMAVVVSGDPLMYSLYKTIKNKLPGVQVQVYPGIGSLQMLAARLGETLEHAVFLSGHGRNLAEGSLALNVYEHEKVLMLCDKVHDPVWAAKTLCDYGLGHVWIGAASNLSYDNEVIQTGMPADIMTHTYDGLCVVLIKNDSPKQVQHLPMLNDDDFVRGKTPMTKEEVRWTIIGKLKLKPDAVVWDIGAGTGSVSVECARQCPFGQVYAVERQADAVMLISKNKEKFELANLHVVHGDALEQIENLPKPTHIFIGGSGRELPELMEKIKKLGKGIQVLASCVTIETLAQASMSFNSGFENEDMVQLCVSRGRKIGSYHILDSNNPVTLLWGQTTDTTQTK